MWCHRFRSQANPLLQPPPSRQWSTWATLSWQKLQTTRTKTSIGIETLRPKWTTQHLHKVTLTLSSKISYSKYRGVVWIQLKRNRFLRKITGDLSWENMLINFKRKLFTVLKSNPNPLKVDKISVGLLCSRFPGIMRQIVILMLQLHAEEI